MSEQDFEAAVAAGLDSVPPELTALMRNVVVLVEDEPPPERAGRHPRPLRRDPAHRARPRLGRRADAAGPHHDLPRSHAARLRERASRWSSEVAVTVVHEIAHHFGIDDDRLHDLGWG